MKNRQQQSTFTLESIRDAIVAALDEAAPEVLKSNEISKTLGIKATDESYDLVREALDELEEQGVIFKTSRRRYGRKAPNVVVEGRLENRRGEWVVIPSDDPENIFEIEHYNLWTAFHGDIVRAKMIVAPRPGERPHGEVTRVISRANPTVVGTVQQGRQFYLDPDDRRMHRTITIRRKDLRGAKAGDKVVLTMYDWNDPYQEPEGAVSQILGRAGDMNAEIASIAAAHRLPHIFPRDVMDEVDAIPSEYGEEDLRDRRDLRDMTIFTIDPVDARDFDDAISIQEHENGEVTLGIHIADVGHYVKEGSAIDQEAYRRGTSVYLVTGVIPMLPERLSNDLCSLRPHEDRLAYSVFVRLSPRGAVKSYEITKSIINSKRRFTYEDALEVLQTGQGDYARELLAINKIAHVLRANRRKKGSIDFDKPETRFRLDENNRPVEVVQKRATESTKLIEDCMLLANRVVAEHIGKARTGSRGGSLNPFIYRIHDVPPKEKLLELAGFVKTFGLSIAVDNVQPKDIQRLVDSAKGTDFEDQVTEMTLRSMAKAVYSDFNVGHFGLAFTYYSHFTSPIRRYPDLIVHRMLHEYGRGMSPARRADFSKNLGAVADHCSERERAAVEAERDSIKIAGVEFLKDHVGDVFEATISGVMRFGIFAELNRFGIEGLVHLRSIRDDYYVFDERAKALRGRHSKKVYRIGDTIHVRVIRVDDVETKIDMELIEEDEYLAEGGDPDEKIERRSHSDGGDEGADESPSGGDDGDTYRAPARRKGGGGGGGKRGRPAGGGSAPSGKGKRPSGGKSTKKPAGKGGGNGIPRETKAGGKRRRK